MILRCANLSLACRPCYRYRTDVTRAGVITPYELELIGFRVSFDPCEAQEALDCHRRPRSEPVTSGLA
jgi:hypothetical protein